MVLLFRQPLFAACLFEVFMIPFNINPSNWSVCSKDVQYVKKNDIWNRFTLSSLLCLLVLILVIFYCLAAIRFCARFDTETDHSAYGAENSNAQPTGQRNYIILCFSKSSCVASKIVSCIFNPCQSICIFWNELTYFSLANDLLPVSFEMHVAFSI